MKAWGAIDVLLIVLILPISAKAQDVEKRYELGFLGTYTFLKEIGTRDVGVGTEVAGLGGRFVYRALRYLDLETDINLLPGNPATSGNHLQGLFGVKAGPRFDKFGFFIKARPGFVYFTRDPFGVSKPGTNFFSHERASSTELNVDVGGVVEYYKSNGLIFRFDLGDSIISYERRLVRISDFLPPLESGGFTTHNWQGSFGVSFRF